LNAFVTRLAPLYAKGQLNVVEIALVSSNSSSRRLLYSPAASLHTGSGADMLACIDVLRRKMEDLEYQHLSAISAGQAAASSTTTVMEKRVQVSLERIGSSDLGALTLARRYVRERIGRQNNRISLDLPETLDGSQCTISFDIMYQVCPVSLTSPRMDDLVADLEALASSGLEVVQRIPLSSLDARYAFVVDMLIFSHRAANVI
jgi:hypothetical protein